MKIKLSKKDWQRIGHKAGWIKQADDQLDLFESNEPTEPPATLEEPVKPKIPKASPHLISAWREATGQYVVFFGTPSGKYYLYQLGAHNGKGPSDVQNWIQTLANKEETKQKAMRIAEQSASWAAETDGNKNLIREIDLTNIR